LFPRGGKVAGQREKTIRNRVKKVLERSEPIREHSEMTYEREKAIREWSEMTYERVKKAQERSEPILERSEPIRTPCRTIFPQVSLSTYRKNKDSEKPGA